MTEPDRILYLAVPEDTYESFFQERFVQAAIAVHQLRLLIYDSDKEAIVIMEGIAFYQKCIRELLKAHVDENSADGQVESQLLIDTENDQYQILDIGWDASWRNSRDFGG